MREIIITPQSAGGRLDKLLLKYLNSAGSGFIYKMLRKKNITLNDKKAEGSVILKAGDSIKMFLSEETIEKFRTEDGEEKLEGPAEKIWQEGLVPGIVFEDENILAINKPSGLLSQRAKPEDVSANDFVLEHLSGSDIFKPGIANRLDRNTSGLLLAGKNPAAARELSRAIKERSISKKYLALVKGKVTLGGTLKGRLLKDAKSNTVRIENIKDPGKGSQENSRSGDLIITEYKPLAGNGEFTLLEVDLITGKSHQIRAHLASIGHPIAGDPKYGDKKINAQLKADYGLRDQLLHAYKIEFKEMSGILEYLNGKSIEAELPYVFAEILKKTKISLT